MDISVFVSVWRVQPMRYYGLLLMNFHENLSDGARTWKSSISFTRFPAYEWLDLYIPSSVHFHDVGFNCFGSSSVGTGFTRIQNKSGPNVNEVLNYQQRWVQKKLSECIQTTLSCNNFYLAFHFITKMLWKDHQSFWETLKVYLTGPNIKERRGGG
jgi:hypothetical protein